MKCRWLILVVLFVAPAVVSGSLMDNSSSPHARVRTVGLDDVRWTDGFWADKFELVRTAALPTIREALHDPENGAQLHNLLVAAGMKSGEHRNNNWSDGDCYKWMEAMAAVYAVTGDKDLDERLDRWISVVAKAQCEDGYISSNIGCDPGKRFPHPRQHELYNMGHLLTAACVHHRATGKDNFLRIARKLGDYLSDTFVPTPPRLMHFPRNPSVYMGLVELYRITGQRRYLETAKVMIGNRGKAPGGTDLSQDHVPLREESEAVGHAVFATYLYSGAADVYAEMDDDSLLRALNRIWTDVTTQNMFITGAVGAERKGHSFRGDDVHEAFLGDYTLPERSAYCETCANTGNGMWNRRMLTLTGDARYADVMERVLYNSMISALSADGRGFFYCNPLRWTGEESGPSLHHKATRWKVCRCYCCPVQVARTVASLHTWAYGVSENTVWVHLFGGSRLQTKLPDGTPVGLVQETDYPWDGTVKFTVTEAPARQLTLRLRIPGWSDGATVTINGRKAAVSHQAGSYLPLKRKWKKDDEVVLELPMRVRLMEAHPAVENLRGKVAVRRGPLVYCLELPKESGGEQVWNDGVFLPANAELQPRHRPDFLGGVTVLEGTALTFEGRDRFRELNPARQPNHENWEGTLYREFRPADPNLKMPDRGTVDITLIPYHAWANRGISFIEVWIPLARTFERFSGK